MKKLFIEEFKKIGESLTLTDEQAQTLAEDAVLIDKLVSVSRAEGLLSIEYIVESVDGPDSEMGYIISDGDESEKNEEVIAIRERYGIKPLNKDSFEKYLSRMIFLVSEGTEPKYVEEISMVTYYMAGFNAFEKLRYLIYLRGILMIQAGDNPWLIERRIYSMLPSLSEKYYDEMRKEVE